MLSAYTTGLLIVNSAFYPHLDSKWVSAFGWVIVINSNGWYNLLATYRRVKAKTSWLEAQAGWFDPKVGTHLMPRCIHHVNQVNSRNGSAMMTAL